MIYLWIRYYTKVWCE